MATRERMTQEEIVLELLQRGPLTTWSATTQHYITQLPARIFYLKEKGHDIRTRPVRSPGGARVVEYFLIRAGVERQPSLVPAPHWDG